MTPKSFDPDTSRQMVGDDRARVIEAKARADADLGKHAYAPPAGTGTGYWGECQAEFGRQVYYEQFRRRLERNERKAPRAPLDP